MKRYLVFVVILSILSLFILSYINEKIATVYNIEENIEKNFHQILKSDETSNEISDFIVETKTNDSKLNRRMIELEIFELKYPKKFNELAKSNKLNIDNIKQYEKNHMSSLNEKQTKILEKDLKDYEKVTLFKGNAMNSIPVLLTITTLLLTEILNSLHKGIKKRNKILTYNYTLSTRISTVFIVLEYYISMFYISKSTEVNHYTSWLFIIYIGYAIIHSITTYILYEIYDLNEE
ncbi:MULTISPECIES: hypothetical protein [Bacillati]|uniref:hypothetical protein n=1 Tax=Bacillati TaxID=1783272 RepID=UPI0019328FFE|nr:hypothetical protein [Staphylococcus epidermidis]MBM0792770.1 hypothetical protein [Staphylococcus epidermidis]MBM0832734.1 hypothetical protein [Staphylococcus epidermidis]